MMMTEKLVSYVSGRTLATFWLMLAVFAALLAFAFIPNSSPLKQAVSSAFLPTVGLLAALGISEIIFVMRERNCSGMLRAFLPGMLERGGGSVVNISSAAGRKADRGFSAYGTAKAAMTHMSRITAMDLAPHIRVNAIAVGSVATDALATVLTDDLRSTMEANTPLRRLGTPEDIAAAVLYLSSPAGSYVTGKVLEVDGGIDHPTLALGLPDYEPRDDG